MVDTPYSMLQLSDLIGSLYQVPIEGRWKPFLKQLAELTQSNKSVFLINDRNLPTAQQFDFYCQNKAHEPLVVEYIPHLNEDPYYIRAQSKPANSVMRGSDIITEQELRQHSLYTLFRQVDTKHLMFYLPYLWEANGKDCALLLNRGEHKSDYTPTDVAFLQLLAPHFDRTLKICDVINTQSQTASFCQSVIDQVEDALIVLDIEGRSVMQNAPAQRLFTDSRAFQFCNGVFRTCCRQANAQLLTILNQLPVSPDNQLAQPDQKFNLSDGSDHYCLNMTLLNAPGDGEFYHGGKLMLTIRREAQPDWRSLAQTHGLTHCELKLYQGLYTGQTLKQLSEQFNVSANTIKSHLKNLMKKTGLHRQSELIKLCQHYL